MGRDRATAQGAIGTASKLGCDQLAALVLVPLCLGRMLRKARVPCTRFLVMNISKLSEYLRSSSMPRRCAVRNYGEPIMQRVVRVKLVRVRENVLADLTTKSYG